MRTQRRKLVTILCGLVTLASVVSAGAQATQEKTARQDAQVVTIQRGAGHGVGVGVGVEPGGYAFSTSQGDSTFVFVSSEMSIDGKLVKGAPYSAQALTESIQTLADGNRIVRRSSASVYRDGEGRTRREQTLNAVGAYSAAGEPQQTIFINDPVAGVNYILDTKNRTARKIDLPAKKWVEAVKAKDPSGGSEEQKKADAAKMAAVKEKAETMMKFEVAAAGGKMMPPGPGGMAFEHFVTKFDSKNTKKESLGKQTIEGVEAEGTRMTTTIAAGEVGNEQPIYIVSESWYSAELQTVVMSKHSDPRFGENTYRLTNINRSEPARSLFELPSDYTVKETVSPNMRYKMEQEIRRPKSENQDN